MAHGVDPAVKEVQPPDAAAIGDRVAVKPGGKQLRLGDHAMLPAANRPAATSGVLPSWE